MLGGSAMSMTPMDEDKLGRSTRSIRSQHSNANVAMGYPVNQPQAQVQRAGSRTLQRHASGGSVVSDADSEGTVKGADRRRMVEENSAVKKPQAVDHSAGAPVTGNPLIRMSPEKMRLLNMSAGSTGNGNGNAIEQGGGMINKHTGVTAKPGQQVQINSEVGSPTSQSMASSRNEAWRTRPEHAFIQHHY